MNQLIMTKGLPASGKSTWAHEYVLSKPAGRAIRVNKDTLREMLHAGRWKGNKTEPQIEQARNLIVEMGLKSGCDVVVDDTNFAPIHEQVLRAMASGYGAQFHIQDFTDVDVEECIKRDLKRVASVGEAVIRKMYHQYLGKASQAIKHESGLPSAVMVDIDGTVALLNGRSPYDPTKYATDKPNVPVLALVHQLHAAGDKIVFCSGRDDIHKPETLDWLYKNLAFVDFELHMRPYPDKRKDWIIKQELFDKFIRGRFNIRFVLDDRNQVVDMWRRIGLPCLQVADGNF